MQTEGHDLVAEAKRITLDVMAEAAVLGGSKGINLILGELDPLVGGTDRVMSMLGVKIPGRAVTAFEGVSGALAELDPATMEACHSLALISITCSQKDRIPAWQGFVQRAHAHYATLRGEDKATELLEGFL